ncbi:glycosyltransferase family 2 protein [Clostridium algidicarnis]|uniref:glycosyltransferase family 2 protein n=1 Tax=Clostridium algidicarnis TaxID=37659 RepID=UPI001C0B0B57|nr:glycosyltransferase family 2 protein [Clostridium algidicarnis]MBU3228074.1 glycosyltransferase family 2 protein [Clostridium algidicarnis]MBU3251757.1 glycosyltransferase family 2 protein [Clostridium algidicarnis]
MDKKVFIILLNYKGVTDTLEAVASLENINYPCYEIVIVDNDSKDGSLDLLKEATFEKHHVISSGRNGGFAFGNNVGIEYALNKGADYVLLINNDTTVEKDFLNHLVDSMEAKENVAITTGLILNYYDKLKIWYDGGEIRWDKFYGYHTNEGKRLNDVTLKEKEITFATGCLMLIDCNVIKKLGPLPEEYFMYYEDVDFCAKIQENGYKIFYNPKSIIYHKIGAASGESESPFAIEWNTRNRLRFMKKYKHKLTSLKYLRLNIFFYTTRGIKLIEYIFKGRNDKAKALIKGLKVRR